MEKKIQNQIRSFRISIDSNDHVKLRLSKIDDSNSSLTNQSNIEQTMPDHWFKVQDISLTGLSCITNANFARNSLEEDIKVHLSFEDFHISVKGKIVRIQKKKDCHFIALKYLFEEGQNFELFFHKFIKTFDHKRVRNQLISLLKDQQETSYDQLSTLDLILNLNKEIEQYTEVDQFNWALLEQWKINLHADQIFSLKVNKGSEDNNSNQTLTFEYQETIHEVQLLDSVLSLCLDEKSTFTAFILNDTTIGAIGEKVNLELKNILCTPVIENGSVIGILLLNRQNKVKFSDEDKKLVQQASSQLGTSLTKSEKIKKENVKFLNPHKPRQYALIGRDEKIQDIRRLIEGTKADQQPILITGGPGTGKTLLAQIIHSESRNTHREFLYLNADRQNHLNKIKKLISTNKVPLEFNSYGTIYIFNSNKLSKSDMSNLYVNVLAGFKNVRVILCPGDDEMDTNFSSEITKKIKKNRLHLPNLNERKDDIPLLIKYLVKIECKKRGYLEKSIGQNVITQFEQHDWSGNIREIKTAVGRLVEFFAHKHHINALPPDSYHVFSVNKNTDYEGNEKVGKLVSSLKKSNYSKEEICLLYQRELILSELDKNGGSLKKTALSLGKPLIFLEELLESSSSIINGKIKSVS